MNTGRPRQHICGISGTQKAYFLAALTRAMSDRPLVIVTYSQYEADRLCEHLSCFLRDVPIGLFPAYDILPHHELLRSADVAEARMSVLRDVIVGAHYPVVIPVKALSRRIVERDVLAAVTFRVRAGDIIELVWTSQRLAMLGYRRSDVVENKGEFCVRGGVLDLFPIADMSPVRMEFFGDEIESIRRFNPNTQRSEDQLEEVLVYPATEFVFTAEEGEAASQSILAELEATVDRLRKMERSAQADSLEDQVREHMSAIQQGADPNLAEEYASHFQKRMVNVLSYFSDPLLIIDEPARVMDAIDGISKEIRSSYVAMIEQGRVLPSQAEAYCSPEAVSAELAKLQSVSLALLARGLTVDGTEGRREMGFRSAPVYQGNLDKIVADLSSWKHKRMRVLVAVSSSDRGKRLVDLFRERDIESTYSEDLSGSLVPGAVVITASDLDGGFIYGDAGLVVLTETEIQGRKRTRHRFRFDDEAGKITSYTDLKAGDLVVHVHMESDDMPE